MPAQRSTFANSTRPQVQTKTKRSPLDEFNFNTIPTTNTVTASGDMKAKTQKKPLDTFESHDETMGGEYVTEKVSVPEPSQSSDDGYAFLSFPYSSWATSRFCGRRADEYSVGMTVFSLMASIAAQMQGKYIFCPSS